MTISQSEKFSIMESLRLGVIRYRELAAKSSGTPIMDALLIKKADEFERLIALLDRIDLEFSLGGSSGVPEDVWAAFHRVWTWSVGRPGYDKKYFLEFERRILDLGRKDGQGQA